MSWLVVALSLWCSAYISGATWNDDKLVCEMPQYEMSYPTH